jgi:hypothetical protein
VLQFYKDLSYRTDVIGKETALVLLFYITCMLRVSHPGLGLGLGTDTKMLYNSNDYTIRHYIMPFENVKIAKMLMY